MARRQRSQESDSTHDKKPLELIPENINILCASKFERLTWLDKEFHPDAISVNSQGWKYFVGLTPGQCIPIDGATYQGIPVVVDRAQVEPVKFIASPGLSAPIDKAAES